MAGRHAKELPIFWGHGTHDPLVKYHLGVESVAAFRSQIGIGTASLDAPDAEGLKGISFNSYSGLGHSTTDKELDDLRGVVEEGVAAGAITGV